MLGIRLSLMALMGTSSNMFLPFARVKVTSNTSLV